MPELAAFIKAVLLGVVLPGFAVSVWLPDRTKGPFRWIYRIGLGLAINPILLLFLSLTGIRLTQTSLNIWCGLLVALLIGHAVRGKLWRRLRKLPSFDPSWLWNFLLVALWVVTFLLRWWPIKDMPVMPGVDANAHALIGALFLESGGIPSDYSPYLPLSSFTYHFGAHANSAVLSLFSDLSIHRVQLLLAPLLIALTVLATFFLAERLTGNRFVSFGAAVLVAFISPFPAWYLNWARLPQMAGVVLLCLVLAEALPFPSRTEEKYPSEPVSPEARFEADGLATKSFRAAFRPSLWLLMAGLILTHYRMMIVFAYAVLVFLAGRAIAARRGQRMKALFSDATGLALGFAPVLLIVLPWVPVVLGSFSFDNVGTITDSRMPPPFYYSLARIRSIIGVDTTIPFLLLALGGVAVDYMELRRDLPFFIYWTLVLLLFSNPYAIPLPWSGLVDFVTVVSILFVPLAVLGGAALAFGISDDADLRVNVQQRSRVLIYCGLVTAVALFGATRTKDILWGPALYVDQADLVAFQWISDSTPDNARFLSPIADAPSRIVQPLDAGGWIAYFTEREQATPLALYRSEKPTNPNYEKDIRLLVEAGEDLGSPEAFSELKRQGVTHLYFGRMSLHRVGPGLELADKYRKVFDHNGVRIFEIL